MVPELCLSLLSRISPASRKLVLVDSIWNDRHQIQDGVAEPMPSTFDVGAFYNSYEKISLSAFAAVPLYRTEDVSIDLFGDLAWYPGTGLTFPVTSADDVIPTAGLQGRYNNLFVQIIPSDGVAADVIITAGVTYAVDRDRFSTCS